MNPLAAIIAVFFVGKLIGGRKAPFGGVVASEGSVPPPVWIPRLIADNEGADVGVARALWYTKPGHPRTIDNVWGIWKEWRLPTWGDRLEVRVTLRRINELDDAAGCVQWTQRSRVTSDGQTNITTDTRGVPTCSPNQIVGVLFRARITPGRRLVVELRHAEKVIRGLYDIAIEYVVYSRPGDDFA